MVLFPAGSIRVPYYRRVVEDSRDRLIHQMKNAAGKLGAHEDDLALFDQALKEKRFTESIKTIKAAIPAELLINGHNPLTLLHDRVSEGLHGRSDEECLHLAASVRVVLLDLSRRIESALERPAGS